MPKVYDLTGQVFGRLTVLEKAGSVSGHMTYRCLCCCGREVVVRGNDLKTGNTKSCGEVGCKKQGVPMEAKTDCFAYLRRQGGAVCSALSEVVCLKQECRFYASVQQVCGKCQKKDCDSCLIVSPQKQMEK